MSALYLAFFIRIVDLCVYSTKDLDIYYDKRNGPCIYCYRYSFIFVQFKEIADFDVFAADLLFTRTTEFGKLLVVALAVLLQSLVVIPEPQNNGDGSEVGDQEADPQNGEQLTDRQQQEVQVREILVLVVQKNGQEGHFGYFELRTPYRN